MSLNKVILMGRLTKDPELIQLRTGRVLVNVDVAVDDSYKDNDGQLQKRVVFVNVTYFGKVSDVINRNFAKGDGIIIDGALKMDQWEKDGKKYSRLKVQGERFEFPLSKPSRPSQAKPNYPDVHDLPFEDDENIPAF